MMSRLKIITTALMLGTLMLVNGASAVPSFTLQMMSPPVMTPNPLATTDFSFDMKLTNTGVQAEEVFGIQFDLTFTPNLPASQFQWLSMTSNVPPANNISKSANGVPASFPVYVMTSLRGVVANAALNAPGNGTTLGINSSVTGATLNFRLAANPFNMAYQVAVSGARISYYDNSTNSVKTTSATGIDGFIAVPEPATLGLLTLLPMLAYRPLRRRGLHNHERKFVP